MNRLESLVTDWPVAGAAVGVTDRERILWRHGDQTWAPRIASVSKLFVGFAALVALEELSISLDEAAGPPGATVRHLLAHASGLAFDSGALLAEPGTRRIYSNTGIERFAAHLATSTGIPFGDYLEEGVLRPLGLIDTVLSGSPAHGIHASIEDLAGFARELLEPTLVSFDTMSMATEAHFPELKGAVPGIGSFDPCPWGLTFELKHGKQPHWTGTTNSWGTFGHFGGTGSFLWVDRAAGLACAAVTDTEFGPWALEAWPRFSDAVIAELI